MCFGMEAELHYFLQTDSQSVDAWRAKKVDVTIPDSDINQASSSLARFIVLCTLFAGTKRQHGTVYSIQYGY